MFRNRRKSHCEKVMAQRKFKKTPVMRSELPDCKEFCGLQQPFFGASDIFAEFKFSLSNGSMNNYCFRWWRARTHGIRIDGSKNTSRFCSYRNVNSPLFRTLGSRSCCLFLSLTGWKMKNKRLRTEYFKWAGASQRITLNLNRLEMKRELVVHVMLMEHLFTTLQGWVNRSGESIHWLHWAGQKQRAWPKSLHTAFPAVTVELV